MNGVPNVFFKLQNVTEKICTIAVFAWVILVFHVVYACMCSMCVYVFVRVIRGIKWRTIWTVEKMKKKKKKKQ